MGKAQFHDRLMEFMSQWELSIPYAVTFSASNRPGGSEKGKSHALLRETHAFGFTAARWFVDLKGAVSWPRPALEHIK
jgi:hypothetical protein